MCAMSPRLLRPIAGGVHPEAAAWRSAVIANGGSVSGSTLNAVSTFCRSIDAAGIRDRFYRLNLFAGTLGSSIATSGVVVPLYRGPSMSGTQYGGTIDTPNAFATTDYAETGASGGLTGNGTSKYLSTGIAQNLFTADSRHLAAYECSKSANSFDDLLGSDNGISVNPWRLTSWNDATKMHYAAQASGTTPPASGAYTGGGGLWVGTGSSTAPVLYRNGSSEASLSGQSAATPGAENVVVFGNSRTGTVTDLSSARLGGYSIGVGMTAQQVSDYYTAMQAFQTALGRNA